MKLIVPRETRNGEKRVALVTESVKKLVKAGISVTIEQDSGAASFIDDRAYAEAGATVATDLKVSLSEADLVLKVNPPTLDEVDLMRPGAMLLAPLTPTRNLDLVRKLLAHKVTAFSTDTIPRISRAQAMEIRGIVSVENAVTLCARSFRTRSRFRVGVRGARSMAPGRIRSTSSRVGGLTFNTRSASESDTLRSVATAAPASA